MSIAQRRITISVGVILAGSIFTALAQLPSVPEGMPEQPSTPQQPVEYRRDLPASQRPPKPPTPPPPASGENESFSFEVSATYEGMYEVTPAGETDSTLVSENFVGLVLQNSMLSDAHKVVVLTAYPDMVIGQYDMVMEQNYPDPSVEYNEPPFQTAQYEASETGTQITLSQDPLVASYVRVKLVDANGEVQEFSISRHGIEMLLQNPNLTENPEKMLEALQRYPFRLPEEARHNYGTFTQHEIFEMAHELPDIARQEIVKSYKVFVADAEAAGRTNIVPPRPKVPIPPPPGAGLPPGTTPYGPLRATGANKDAPTALANDKGTSAPTTTPLTVPQEKKSRVWPVLGILALCVVAIAAGFALGRRR